MKMTSLLALCFVVSCLCINGQAQADPIQMLPPVQSGTTTTPCVDDGANKFLSWDGQTSIKCQGSAIIDSSGNVGVGTTSPQAKLDVAGGVKVGADNAGCVAAKKGTVRSVGQEMQFCDGSNWTRLAMGPLFGGIFQTYLCDTRGVYHGADLNGGCRVANTVTGSCGCPDGYTLQRINDYSVPAGICPQSFYENRGMMQWLCVKP